MSYNNYLDGDAAYSAACDFSEPTCVIVKHTNPCGVATRNDLKEAYRLAVQADPISAFGGIVAFNRCVFLVLPCLQAQAISSPLCIHVSRSFSTSSLAAEILCNGRDYGF